MDDKTNENFTIGSVWLNTILIVLFFAAVFFGIYCQGATVEFLAVGKPSMLNIRGNCGEVQVNTNTHDTYFAEIKLVKEDGSATCPTGIGLRDRHMLKHLEADKFPIAKAEVKFEKVDYGKFVPGKCTGFLEIHGKKADISECSATEKTLTFKTKISAHAMEAPAFLGVTVADEVQISVALDK
jgi:hypothetical protein